MELIHWRQKVPEVGCAVKNTGFLKKKDRNNDTIFAQQKVRVRVQISSQLHCTLVYHEVELREDTASCSCREHDESQQNEQGHEAAERHDRKAVMTATEAQMQRLKVR